MQRPERVMLWVAENIQACLRIFRRAQHQWLARDILHLPQGVFDVFVLWPGWGFKRFKGFKGFKWFKRIKWFKRFKRFKMFKRFKGFKWFKGFKRFKGFDSALSVIEKKRRGNYWTGMSGRRD